MAETYEVVWSGTKEKQEHDRQVRPAPELPAPQGSTGKVKLRMDGLDGLRRSDEDTAVMESSRAMADLQTGLKLHDGATRPTR
jgi:hypothetical protein